MTTLSNQIKMTDAMERELNEREHDALGSWAFNEPVEFAFVAIAVAAFCIGSLLLAIYFH